ncbi:MAG TPA: YihY/virulence factor BrkB family protein [Polyangiaceae bacterium]|jgi:membrane protein|nr:YihY/virulence factor BrkB family protein [Polyangiaceae bacterium]
MRDVVRDVYKNFVRHDGLQLASAMAFDLFLALVPLLALGGWATSRVVGADATALQNVSLWLDVAPTDVQRIIEQHTNRMRGQAVAPLVLLGALWLGSGAFATVMAGFEKTSPSDPRPWWVRRAIAMLCVPCFLAALVLSAWLALHVVGVAAVDALPRFVFMKEIEVNTAATIGLLVSVVFVTLLIAAFFRVALRRDVPRRCVWPGTMLALGIGSSASYGFAVYAGTLAQYAVYYGSLAAVAVLMAWLWICSVALLLGAELNVFLEEQIAIDSRRPAPRSS